MRLDGILQDLAFHKIIFDCPAANEQGVIFVLGVHGQLDALFLGGGEGAVLPARAAEQQRIGAAGVTASDRGQKIQIGKSEQSRHQQKESFFHFVSPRE